MTEEQIKRKAKTYSRNYWYNTNNSVNEASIEKLLIDFATEATKELQEKLVTIEKDDIRKAELQKRETLAEKLEFLKQVETYAIFNDDTKIMFWTSCMKSEIIQELQRR